MGRRPSKGKTASWDGLYELAADQGGYFSTSQAGELGFTTARLQHHVNVGKLVRESRGVLRLQQFPTGQLGEYIVLWLWSGREGVFSHETALMLHELSDAMPAKFHLTLPESWSTRRLRVPAELVVHFADVPAADRTWKEHVPLTSPKRTIEDCFRDGTSPELTEHALTEARERGLVSSDFAKRFRRKRR